jgi:hypothetical protein
MIVASSWVPYVVFPGVTLAAIVLLAWGIVMYVHERKAAGPMPKTPRLRILPAEALAAVCTVALVIAMSIATYHRMR